MHRFVVAVSVLAAVSVIATIIAFYGWAHYSHRVNTIVVSNCQAIEGLKAIQYQAAVATINGDMAFLKAHPGGTADFPEAVVRQDIADKEETKRLTAPMPCVKP